MSVYVAISSVGTTPEGAAAFSSRGWLATPVDSVFLRVGSVSRDEVVGELGDVVRGAASVDEVVLTECHTLRRLCLTMPVGAPAAAVRQTLDGDRRLVLVAIGDECARHAGELFRAGWTRGCLDSVFLRLVCPGDRWAKVRGRFVRIFEGAACPPKVHAHWLTYGSRYLAAELPAAPVPAGEEPA
jgi:hypothetical protein